MKSTRPQSASSSSWVRKLAHSQAIDTLTPIAARFVYSLRLIALHERANRDPIPELALQLGDVSAAAKSLALAQSIGASWPDRILVSRFCCRFLTYDETTIGNMIGHADARDNAAFRRELAGLIRPDRIERLLGDVLALIATESQPQ